MKARYLLAALSLTALSSCATYNEMRMDPKLRAQKAAEAAQKAEANEATVKPQAALPKPVKPSVRPQQYRKPVATPTSRKLNRRDTGDFMRPDSLYIPSKADLKETATSTEQPTGTPGLTVPAR